jgi:hypothetical protein
MHALDALQQALSHFLVPALATFQQRGKQPFFAVPGAILYLNAAGEIAPLPTPRFLTRADLHCMPIEDLLGLVLRQPAPRTATAAVVAITLRPDGDLWDQVSELPDSLLLYAAPLDLPAGVLLTARHHHPISETSGRRHAGAPLHIEQRHQALRTARPEHAAYPTSSLSH